MGGLYDILESYRRQNNPNLNYEGLFEERVYPSIPQDPPFVEPTRSFMSMSDRGDFGVPRQDQIDQNQFTDDAGREEEYYEDFPQKFNPGFNMDFAKQLGSGILGLATNNPLAGLVAKGLGYLGDKFSLPGVVGGADLRGDTGLDTFRRSTSLQDFFQRRRDQNAREEAAARGLAKQRNQALQAMTSNQAYGGNQGGNGGGGFADNSNASAPGGSNEMGSF